MTAKSDFTATLPASDPLVALRRRHQALLARAATEAAGQDERHAFMAALEQAGESFSAERARDALRGMLFYWAADATTRGELPKDAPLPRLADFVTAESAEIASEGIDDGAQTASSPPKSAKPSSPPEAPTTSQTSPGSTDASSPEVVGPAGNARPGTIFGNVILSLPGGARDQSSLTNILGGIVGEGLTKAVKAGQVVSAGVEALKRIGAGGSEERPAADAAPAAPPQPETVALSDVEAVARARAVLRLSGYARLWRRAEPDKKKDYLLTGSALTEALLYVDDDVDIKALVDASEEARGADIKRGLKVRNLWIAGLAVALLAAGGLIWQLSEQRKLLLYQSQLLTVEGQKLQQAHDNLIAANADKLRAEQAKSAELERRLAAERQEAAARERIENPDQLRQQEQRKAEAIRQPEANAVAAEASSRDPASSVAMPLPGAPAQTCTGYLWFGSATESRLADGRDPTTLRSGEVVRINTASDLRLRAEAPSQSYVMAAQIGLVQAGSSVRLAAPPLPPYPRTAGPQIWARVSVPRQFCTTVFIQYTGNAGDLPAIKSQLEGIGVQVPPAERLDTAKAKAEVRYYWKEDAAIALQVANTLAGFSATKKPLLLTPLLDFPARAKPKATNIEVWIDLD